MPRINITNAPGEVTTVVVDGNLVAGGPSAPSGPSGPAGGDQVTSVAWPGAAGQVRAETSGFCAQNWSFAVTIPADCPQTKDAAHVGIVQTAEVPGQQTTFREMTVSRDPNDFGGATVIYSTIGNPDIGPRMSFSVSNPTLGADCNLLPGETLYWNFRNWYQGKCSCLTPTCDMIFDLAIPNRSA